MTETKILKIYLVIVFLIVTNAFSFANNLRLIHKLKLRPICSTELGFSIPVEQTCKDKR